MLEAASFLLGHNTGNHVHEDNSKIAVARFRGYMFILSIFHTALDGNTSAVGILILLHKRLLRFRWLYTFVRTKLLE